MPQIESISFQNYKSFTSESDNTIALKQINVLIGRNNAGKSSCIDVIEAMTDSELFQSVNIDIRCMIKIFSYEIEREPTISPVYSKTSISKWNETALPFQVSASFLETERERLTLNPIDGTYPTLSQHCDNPNQVLSKINDMLSGMIFHRLNAERDIKTESEDKKLSLSANGDGATTIINHVLNDAGQDEQWVRHDLLKALNAIIMPDDCYDGITTLRNNDKTWEVYFHEEKGRFALSKMGSGLKTIILVLLNLLIIPKLNGYGDKNILVYAFEELENNLHPALQRRLFDYINSFCEKHKNVYVFLTTHSHVAINIFFNKSEAQILHIVKNNHQSKIQVIDDFISKNVVLQDLDVRASDLFQSNGIIWVEGPSDRVYIKHWMQLCGGSNLIEGVDYQFLYYGGKLLARYTADEAETQLINILTTNRNSAIIMDSDLKENDGKIRSTKERVQKEFREKKLFCWITAGREIENYISCDAINNAFSYSLNQCDQFEFFPDYIASEKRNFASDKVGFAEVVVQSITNDDIHFLYDLKEKIQSLVQTIRQWNNKI